MHQRPEQAPEPEMVREMALGTEPGMALEIVALVMGSVTALGTELETVQAPDNRANLAHLPNPLPFVKLRRENHRISLLARVAIVPAVKITVTWMNT
jgi:hypothetical protein